MMAAVRPSLTERDVRNFRLLNFCWTECTYYTKGVKQFVVIIDASHFSNYNSYAISHIKILFQTEQWGVFSENTFWALHKMCLSHCTGNWVQLTGLEV